MPIVLTTHRLPGRPPSPLSSQTRLGLVVAGMTHAFGTHLQQDNGANVVSSSGSIRPIISTCVSEERGPFEERGSKEGRVGGSKLRVHTGRSTASGADR